MSDVATKVVLALEFEVPVDIPKPVWAGTVEPINKAAIDKAWKDLEAHVCGREYTATLAWTRLGWKTLSTEVTVKEGD